MGVESADGFAAPSPSEGLPPLTEEDLTVLEAVGRRWRARLAGGPEVLPVDPSLERSNVEPKPTRFGRFAPISMFAPVGVRELVAADSAAADEDSSWERGYRRARRLILGPSLQSSAVVYERMRKLIALPVLSGDLLSSVAYGSEAMIAVLVLAGSGALGNELPLGLCLVTLMILVGISYRQTIRAYPSGAGSYIVATDNLGELPGLLAAAGLITDYVLTVSVSIAAGIAAVTSAIPEVRPETVLLGVSVIVILLVGNLRGVRQAGHLFALPTTVFLVAMVVLIVAGWVKVIGRGFTEIPAPHVLAVSALTPFLVLRAFASGATSMTGIEAVSNAVPVFKPIQWRNARRVLSAMITILVALFAALLLLIHWQGLVPEARQTILSQLAATVFGRGPVYGFIQVSTALVLIFAADAAFNDFPRVLYFMARDHHAPRSFLRMGDRLGFSNGITALALLSAAVFVAFRGHTESLIPLYAIGVFLAFTLSQAGMVTHWWRLKTFHWRRSLAINGVGATASAAVLVTGATTKFTAGAWVVLLAIPLLAVFLLRIKRHYTDVAGKTRIGTAIERPDRAELDLAAGHERLLAGDETLLFPDPLAHLFVVPIAHLDLPGIRALAYALSLRRPTLALHVSPEQAEADRFEEGWDRFGVPVPLEVVVSPYRAVVGPIINYLESLHEQAPEITITVVVPELKVRKVWHRLLHERLADRLRRGLENHEGIAVTEVPFHL